MAVKRCSSAEDEHSFWMSIPEGRSATQADLRMFMRGSGFTDDKQEHVELIKKATTVFYHFPQSSLKLGKIALSQEWHNTGGPLRMQFCPGGAGGGRFLCRSPVPLFLISSLHIHWYGMARSEVDGIWLFAA